MSYLPLAHIYERVMTIGFVAQGIAIGFFRCAALLGAVIGSMLTARKACVTCLHCVHANAGGACVLQQMHCLHAGADPAAQTS